MTCQPLKCMSLNIHIQITYNSDNVLSSVGIVLRLKCICHFIGVICIIICRKIAIYHNLLSLGIAMIKIENKHCT